MRDGRPFESGASPGQRAGMSASVVVPGLRTSKPAPYTGESPQAGHIRPQEEAPNFSRLTGKELSMIQDTETVDEADTV